MAIQGTYGIMFFVGDMRKASEFYAAKLGFKARYESEEWTEFDIGDGTAICLHHVTDGRKTPPGGIPILKVTGIRELVASLEKKGVKVVRPVFEVHPGSYGADIEDQGGFALHLYESSR
jgi:predicted enzyme related to lactoylglutathione lyase